ncbi:DUF2157 domain-containing protein [Pacificimonas sp. WHA3]|uniref:DUF2157 domain-containing protein n=1 Tax=Pacificimonas pallii TaxID=2827236 RepID=A0ABS6SBT9_9SPHN|nr:DUF2157 domain-containing protein [Pacificimonas pallii]MBV7255690.1 DUF2157 domain-containing protein [Pacificimonas pallii]
MAIADKIASWQSAGLIDADTAARIAAFEEERARPTALWAVIGLGCLALALGIANVVAANWQAIPDALKLGVHFAMTAGAAFACWRSLDRGAVWFAEGALFVLGALFLAGLSLHAQVYQLSGEIWQLLVTWLLCAGPAFLLLGRTRLTAYALAGMTIWAGASWAGAANEESWAGLFAQGLAMSVPWALVALAALCQGRSRFSSGLSEMGLSAILIAVSIAHVAWADPIPEIDAGEMRVRLLVAGAGAALALALAWRGRLFPRDLLLALVTAPFAALVLAVGIEHGDGPVPRFIGALIYAAMWGGIAWAASRAGWRTVFGLAIGALAVRLFIVYFELFGSLAMTGMGLIFAGALLIALALGWRRIFSGFRKAGP